MVEKKLLVDWFVDMLCGEVVCCEMLLCEVGCKVQGSVFNLVFEYENVIVVGYSLLFILILFVVVDEFILMLVDYLEYVELFDYVVCKGCLFCIYILFVFQILDVGKIKDIDKNIVYWIGLKVVSFSVFCQIIGVEDVYYIELGKEYKGVGFLVFVFGVILIRFCSIYVDGIYELLQMVKVVVV